MDDQGQKKPGYVGFQKLSQTLAQRPGVQDPQALAAYIARKKYGNAKLQQAAAAGKSMKNMKPVGSE